ncbi:hypothetical protein [Streptomyces sp. NPDC094466]|uniref:hypothetical protein n=1 Tax=Streptomyces sp. NPDC094466 TaxID=3366065 RepID=UPI0038267128
MEIGEEGGMREDLGPLIINRRGGHEPLAVGGQTQGTLLDFWRWACSDLAGNALRGILAEYIVALALDAATGVRTEWDAVDIRTSEGLHVEVKSSAYLQSWSQSKPSNISFSIAPASGWDGQTDEYSPESLRRSDVYVFCVLHHQDKRTLDPLNLDQWDFYVLATSVLNEACPVQRTISLASLQRLTPARTGFTGLRQHVASCVAAEEAPRGAAQQRPSKTPPPVST